MCECANVWMQAALKMLMSGTSMSVSKD